MKMVALIGKFVPVLLIALLSGCGMNDERLSCSSQLRDICEQFTDGDQLSLIITLPGAKAGQIDEVKNVQNQFIADLPEDVRIIRLYKVTPQVALETSLSGLKDIVGNHPDVEIALDEMRNPIENN